MLSEPHIGCCSSQRENNNKNNTTNTSVPLPGQETTELPFGNGLTPATPNLNASTAGNLPLNTLVSHGLAFGNTGSYSSGLQSLLGSAVGGRYHRKWRRVHGLQAPLHPLQVAGWLALGASAVGSFLVLVPALRSPLCRAITAALLSSFYLLHIASHLGALLLDPAEAQLRAIPAKAAPVPEFDRAKHAHVIENGRCHLCNVHTSGHRTKHCAVCNKCVARFDHHCKWLNQCIGGRNYAAFLMCVATAVAAAITVAVLALTEIVLYYVQPHWLILWDTAADTIITATTSTTTQSSTTTTGQTSSAPPLSSTTSTSSPTSTTHSAAAVGLVSGDVAFLVVVGVLGLLAAITAGLLLHLCFFHVYISFLGLTTYEYIRTQRQSQSSHPASPTNALDNNTNISPDSICNPNNSTLSADNATNERRPTNLHCCRGAATTTTNSRMSYYACAFLENRTETCNGCSSNGTSHSHDSSSEYDSRISTPKMYTLEEEGKEGSNSAGNSPARKIRTQRKWNCCISVPDSPDDPASSDAGTTTATVHKTKCLLSLCKYRSSKTKTSLQAQQVALTTSSTTMATNTTGDEDAARQNVSGGPRIRVLFRVFGHWTHGRRQRQQQLNTSYAGPPVRNNQVVPLSEESAANDGVQVK